MVKIKSLFISSLVILLLAGCVHNPPAHKPEPEVKTVIVEVPVFAERDPPPSRDLPNLGLKNITINSSPRDTALAYDRAIQVLIDEVLWYRKILYGDAHKE